MDNYIYLDQAAAISGISKNELLTKIRRGNIKAIMVNGSVIMVRERDINKLLNDNKITRSDFSDLDGKPILSIRAAEKYGIPNSTLSGWIKRGWIKVIKRSTKRVWIDEGDVAFVATKFNLDPGRGKKSHVIK